MNYESRDGREGRGTHTATSEKDDAQNCYQRCAGFQNWYSSRGIKEEAPVRVLVSMMRRTTRLTIWWVPGSAVFISWSRRRRRRRRRRE
jgi:hypothetical protein